MRFRSMTCVIVCLIFTLNAGGCAAAGVGLGALTLYRINKGAQNAGKHAQEQVRQAQQQQASQVTPPDDASAAHPLRTEVAAEQK